MSVVKNMSALVLQSTVSPYTSSVLGTLIEVTEQGVPMVTFPEHKGEAIPAKSTLSATDCAAISALPVPVLLMFEGGDLMQVVVVGVVRETLFPIAGCAKAYQEVVVDPNQAKPLHALIDGKSVTLNASEEIELRCGKSTILLRKDGKIVIKGVEILSRSSRTHKIKGASVNIN